MWDRNERTNEAPDVVLAQELMRLNDFIGGHDDPEEFMTIRQALEDITEQLAVSNYIKLTDPDDPADQEDRVTLKQNLRDRISGGWL